MKTDIQELINEIARIAKNEAQSVLGSKTIHTWEFLNRNSRQELLRLSGYANDEPVIPNGKAK